MTCISSKKIPPWGKLLQFSWGNLLHCNCHTWGIKIGLKCNRITLFIKFYAEIHHFYAFLHDKEVQMVSFITAVEINVQNFHLHLTRAQTKKTTHKQTQWHMYMGEVVERCTIAHFRTFITSNPCRIVECSSFLYFSVPMYRKQLGLSENIYVCSLSLDFLAVIAFQSSKNHENSDFPVKFTYISFSSFLKSHFTAHCEFCALPHTSQFKYQILLECLDAKSRAPGKAE